MHHRIAILSVLCAAVFGGGCQTYITAEKRPESILPVSDSSGNVTGYIIASGGWTASARSPLWAAESLRGLDIGVGTNGTVHLILGEYNRDLSTNAVAVTRILTDGAVNLAAKITAAIVSSGASPAADGIAALGSRYRAAGGDAEKAQITCSDGTCTVTDGAITCTDGGCCGEDCTP